MRAFKVLILTITILLCLTTTFTTALLSAEQRPATISLTSTTSQQHRLPVLSNSLQTESTSSSSSSSSSSDGSNSNNRFQHVTRLHQYKQHQRLHSHVGTRYIRKQTANLSRTTTQTTPTITHHPDHDVEIIGQAAMSATNIETSKQNTTRRSHLSTRLRRLNGRDYYNNGSQRRSRVGGVGAGAGNGNNDWAYNTYNVQTNTFGAPPPPYSTNAGKGDDNTLDVEFIGNSNSKPEWSISSYPRRSDGNPIHTTIAPSTSAPPPLVPARRGYLTTMRPKLRSNELSPVTEDPFETNTISRNPHTNDPKDMERRHICVQQRTITMPVKTTEVYMRPIWKHVNTPCQPPTYPNQMCTRVQLVHEQAYRDVIRQKSAQHVTFDCCTGWMRETPHADACMKPICSTNCQNGGSCIGPDTCTCSSGFTGRHCEHDINECKEEKPCDQTCINTVGSYYCKCRPGFVLQADQQSCKKIDYQDDDAFEARDLENEIETENENENGAHSRDNEVTARLHKIERSLANERVHTNELQKSLQATYHIVDSLKSRLITLEKQQQDLNRLQTNMYETENRTNKLEGMVNLLMKCRNGPNAYCP